MKQHCDQRTGSYQCLWCVEAQAAGAVASTNRAGATVSWGLDKRYEQKLYCGTCCH